MTSDLPPTFELKVPTTVCLATCIVSTGTVDVVSLGDYQLVVFTLPSRVGLEVLSVAALIRSGSSETRTQVSKDIYFIYRITHIICSL